MQLPLPVVLAAQKVLDKVLMSQPDIDVHMAPLDESVVCIHVDTFDLPFYWIFNGERVELARFFDGVVDVTLSGSLPALLAMTRNADGLFNGDITIAGDVGLAHHLNAFFGAIDIDWEEQLSNIVGDAPAHQLGNLHKSATRWLSSSLSGFLADGGEYIQEEIQVVAPNSEIERFCRDVDELRSATDRLEARLNQLMSAPSGTHHS